MSTAVKITRRDPLPTELRALAARSDDTAQTRRLLAIAMVVEGTSRLDAARQTGMDRQTLRDWVHRYNAVGIDGLASRKPPGAAPKLSGAQTMELDGLVMAGPDPKIHKVVRWRCVDLRAEVTKRFSVTVSERTIAKWLRKLKLTRLQPRPFHPKRDEAAQEAFKEHFTAALKRALLGSTAATPVEIWLQDEARVGQKGGHTYVWAKVGSRPPMVRDNRHDSAYLFGAIYPVRAVGAVIIAPTANTECMNLHLREISTQVTSGLDRSAALRSSRLAPDRRRTRGAGQHRSAALSGPFPGAEPNGERLGILVRQQAFRPCLGQLRGNHRGLRGRLELVHR
jgi:transposase